MISPWLGGGGGGEEYVKGRPVIINRVKETRGSAVVTWEKDRSKPGGITHGLCVHSTIVMMEGEKQSIKRKSRRGGGIVYKEGGQT